MLPLFNAILGNDRQLPNAHAGAQQSITADDSERPLSPASASAQTTVALTLHLTSQLVHSGTHLSILPPLVFHHYPLGMTKDPFASTASLDVNPFDDPFADQDSVNKPSPYSHELAASRVADLDHRERDLERRERELQQKAEPIRKHGRNNWPPGDYPLRSIRRPKSIHTHIPPYVP